MGSNEEGSRQPSAGTRGTPEDVPGDHGTGARIITAVTDVAVKVIAALGTTAGFLTLVAGTGGAVLWARFHAASLPADQALAVVPRRELVAAGASALAVFLVLGLVAALAVWSIDANNRGRTSLSLGLCALVTAELVAAAWLVIDVADWKRWVFVAWCVLVFLTAVGLAAAAARWDAVGALLLRRAEAQRPTLGQLREAKERRALGDTSELPRRRRLTNKAFGAAAAFAAVTALLGTALGGWVLGVAVLVAMLTTGVCFGIAEALAPRIWPYAIAVFFAVGIFGAVVMTSRLVDRPKLNPVALLRVNDAGPQGVIGLLVGRADDRYWLGAASQLCGEDGEPTGRGVKGRGRIFAVPRSEVRGEQIGSLILLDEADDQARSLLREVIARQHPRPEGVERIDARKLQPPAVSPCGGAADDDGSSAPPRARIAVARQPGEPYRWVLDASGSRDDGAIARWTWQLPTGRRSHRAVAVVRLPARQRQAADVRLVVHDLEGQADAASVTLHPPLRGRTLFDTDEATLTEAGRRALRRLAKDVRRGDRVIVEGHADATGAESHNERLARDRAREVAAELARRARLPSERIEVRSYGETLPVASNETAAGRRANRRVQVLVLHP